MRAPVSGSGGGSRVLVLGASGMLGNTVLRYFASKGRHRLMGSIRSPASRELLPEELRERVIIGGDLGSQARLTELFDSAQPEVVINCIGLVKQLTQANDPLNAIAINALLPHRLAQLCGIAQARLLQVSTDCVFSGSRGMYREEDAADASDLYGRSKLLGEVVYPHTLTLRTSVIGHELDSAHGLICWFLAQRDEVRGFRKAVFSGMPAVELARIMHDFIIPNDQLRGLYHVSVEPIDKYSLLQQVASAYHKSIIVVPDDSVVIDRSLDSARFRAATGYVPPAWHALIAHMREFG